MVGIQGTHAHILVLPQAPCMTPSAALFYLKDVQTCSWSPTKC